MAGVLRGDTAGTLCGDGRRSRREPARSRRSPGRPLCSRSCVWRGRLAQTRGGRQTEDPAPQAAATALRAPGRPVLPSSCPRPRIGHQWALGGTPCWRRPTQRSEKRSARSLSAGRVRDGGAVTPVPRGPLLRACGDATLPRRCRSPASPWVALPCYVEVLSLRSGVGGARQPPRTARGPRSRP